MVGSSLLQLDGTPRNRDSGNHGRPLERAQTRPTVDKNEQGFFLRALYDEGKPFCIPTEAETDGGEMTMARRFGLLLVAAWATSSGALALGMALAVAAGDPPLRNNSAWEASE
jgi:hypothetical protein